jgi:hypothetical protein
MPVSAPLKRLTLSVAAYIEPPEDILPDEWAEKHVEITEGDDLGLIRFDRGRKYQREILNSFFRPFYPGEKRRIGVSYKGAQAGLSLICTIGALYRNIVLKRSVAHMYPREPDAKEKARKLKEMIDASPFLSRKYKRGGRIRRTVDNQTFRIPYASSIEELVNWQCGDFITDEMDRCESDKYSAVDALKQRTGSYKKTLELYVGTPTLPDYGIHLVWQQSDQRYFWVPCLACGRKQTITFQENIAWDKGPKTVEEQAATAFMKCKHCDAQWGGRVRELQNEAGEWISKHPKRPTIGFAVNRLYVPASNPAKIVSDYLRGLQNDRAMREHVNQNEGRVYMPTFGGLTKSMVERTIQPSIPWRQVPSDTIKITGGFDVQGNEPPFSYPFEIRAYNDQNMATTIEYGIANSHKEVEELLGTHDKPGFYDCHAALMDITDGEHKLDVEELCEKIPCLYPGRFDEHAKTNFNTHKEQKIKTGSTAGIGYVLDREPVVEANMSRFFKTDKRDLKIRIAQNPKFGKQSEFVEQYTKLKRKRVKGRLKYIKLRQTDVDFPFAGAFADHAAVLSVDHPGSAKAGLLENVENDRIPDDIFDSDADDFGTHFIKPDHGYF